MKVRELFSLVKSDFVRLFEFWQKELTILGALKALMMPTMFAIMLYRLYHFLYINNFRFLSWPLWALNITMTGADIHPSCVIGRGLFIGHSNGITLTCRLGDSVTILGNVSIGSGAGDLSKDVGAGPGMPYVKSNAQIGFGATILGAVTVGEFAKVAPCTYLRKSLGDGGLAYGNPAKLVASSDATTF